MTTDSPNHMTDPTPQYQAGWDCGWNGPNMQNSHFRHFATPAMRDDWERGKRDADETRRKAI